MVVQTGPRLKRGFEGRIERGQVRCAAAALHWGLRGRLGGVSGGGAATSGAGVTMSYPD